jgi:hypothetical protein
MIAKYPGTCQYCQQPIGAGDEITRGNGERRHAGYGHARCVPTAGVVRRAGFEVEVVQGDAKGYIAAGHRRQFVRQGYAQSIAQHLRDLGCKQVEVRPLS